MTYKKQYKKESRQNEHASREVYFYRKMPLRKIHFIQFTQKEKYGAVTKLKLVQKKRNQKFKNYNQLDF